MKAKKMVIIILILFSYLVTSCKKLRDWRIIHIVIRYGVYKFKPLCGLRLKFIYKLNSVRRLRFKVCSFDSDFKKSF